jgi:hypothetical protein
VDRAARAAAALLQQEQSHFVIDCDEAGSPQKMQIDSADRLQPSDSLVDSISLENQGAANVFRFDSTSGSFDRVTTNTVVRRLL